jgi:hypothetical protein
MSSSSSDLRPLSFVVPSFPLLLGVCFILWSLPGFHHFRSSFFLPSLGVSWLVPGYAATQAYHSLEDLPFMRVSRLVPGYAATQAYHSLEDLPSHMTLLQLLNTNILSFEPNEPHGYFVEKLGTRESWTFLSYSTTSFTEQTLLKATNLHSVAGFAEETWERNCTGSWKASSHAIWANIGMNEPSGA